MMPRKSIEEHELQGTLPTYAVGECESGKPRCPKSLSPQARKKFRMLAKILERRHTLTPGEQELLMLYCEAFDRHAQASAKLKEEGYVRTYTRVSKGGNAIEVESENLWLPILTNAEKFMRGCLQDLGLTPLQRSRVRPTKQKPERNLEEERLLSREAAKAQSEKDSESELNAAMDAAEQVTL